MRSHRGRAAGLEGTRQWLATEGRKFASFHWRERMVVAESDLVVQFGAGGGECPGGVFWGFDAPAGPYRCGSPALAADLGEHRIRSNRRASNARLRDADRSLSDLDEVTWTRHGLSKYRVKVTIAAAALERWDRDRSS